MKQSIARHIIASHTCFSRGNTPFLLEKHSVSLGEALRSSVYLSCKQTLLTLLLLISGVVGSWGQDYSGTYYIASVNPILSPKYNEATPSTNYYLCSTENWYYYQSSSPYYTNTADANNVMPFMTTYKCRDGVNDAKAVWSIIKKEGTNYYYIKHDGKFLTYNVKMENNSNEGRMRMHLETSPTDDNSALFQISYVENPMENSSPCFDIITIKETKRKYVNVSGDNQDSYQGTNAKQDGPNNLYVGGIIGLWTGGSSADKNSQWWLEIPSPTFSLNGDNKVEIQAFGDADVYYTTDGTDPNVPAEGVSPSTPTSKYTGPIDLVNGQIMVKAIATNKDHHSVSSSVATYVYNPDITWSETSFVYNGTAQTPTEISVKIGNIVVDDTKYAISCGSNTNAGSATLTLSDKDDKDNYYIVNKAIEFTIAPRTATLTWTDTSLPYNKTQQKPTATVGNLVTGDECTVTVTVPDGDGITVGEYTATATVLSNKNYALPTEKTQTFNIVQKDITISGITAANKVYDKTTTATLGYTNVTFGGKADGDVLTITATGAFEDANAGEGKTVNISGLVLGGEETIIANYKLAETGQQTTATANITQRDVTVISGITAENKVYDGTTTATLVCSSAVIDGLLEDDELTVAAATGTFADKNVGEGKVVTITEFTMGGTSGGNYKVADTGNQTSTTANITQRVATLTWGTNALTYNATAQAPTATVSNVAEGDNVTVTVTGAQTNVGDNYTATAIALSDANYKLPAEGLTCTFTISSATLTVEAMPQTKVYGDADPALTYTATGLLGSDAITGALVRTEGNNVGEYDISQGTLAASNNYTIAFTGAKFTITKATLAITADDKSKIYGATDPELTYTVAGLKYEDTKESVLSGALARATGEQVGVYAINQGSLTSGINYAISYTGANLTITKVGLTITANNNTITYGDAPAGNGITCEGFVNSETASVLSGTVGYDFSYKQFDNVGNTYTITPKGLTSDNYDITFVAGTLTVNPKKVGLTWDATTFEYDGSAHAPTATATGWVHNDAISVTVTGAQTNAGSYTATASALTGEKAGNYKLPEAKTKAFTITPKSIGTGTLADVYTLDFGENNTILLTDKDIGSALVLDTDYSVSADSDNSPQYSQRTVTGKGNYTGSFDVRNVVISFTTDNDQEEWSATIVAGNGSGFDLELGLALPEGVSAFIISGIQGDWAIPEPLNYIPKGVPVLLVAHKEINGFVPTKAENGDVTPIPIEDTQEARNMLEVVTADTPGYDAVTQSAPFATKQIYVLFKNEFVFNKAGDMPKGKVYLNPNHTAPSSSPSPDPAPARLKIAWNYTTGIKDGKWTVDDGRSERWYTLDGRCLSSKPTTKGLYIVNGKKVVIK